MGSSISKFVFPLRIERVLPAVYLVVGGCGILHADLNSNATPKLKKKDVPATVSQPSALPEVATAEVNRGGETNIRLRGIARGGGQVEFKLLQKPAYGKIVQVTPVGLDTMDLTYRHVGAPNQSEDSLVFAVRAGGAGPFSPARAKIRIKDLPGRLQAPEFLEFPATLAGKASTETFVVVNEGGTRLDGVVTVNGPWKIDGPLEYDLKPGETRKIAVFFTPDRDGPIQGRIRFEGSMPAVVELRGQGSAPFLSSAKTIKLTETEAGKRSGSVSLQNNTSGPLTIQVQSELISPKEVTLKFGETRDLTIEDQGIGLIQTFVALNTNGFQQRIEVTAEERVVEKPAPVIDQPDIALPARPRQAEVPGQTSAARETRVSAGAGVVSPDADPNTLVKGTAFSHYIPVQITAISNSKVQLKWTLPTTGGKSTYAIEERRMSLDGQHDLKIEWLPVRDAEIQLNGNKGIATIDGLKSGTAFTFRVTEKSGGTSARQTSLPLVYHTGPGFFRRLDWRWPLFFGAAIMVVFVIRKRWQERAASW